MCESGWRLYAQEPRLVDPEWGTPLNVPEEDWPDELDLFDDLEPLDEDFGEEVPS